MTFQLYLDDEQDLGEKLIGVSAAVEMALSQINPKGIVRINMHLQSGQRKTSVALNSKILDIQCGIDYAYLRTLEDATIGQLYDVIFRALLDALPALTSQLQDSWTFFSSSQYRPALVVWSKKRNGTVYQISILFTTKCATLYLETIGPEGDNTTQKIMEVHPSRLIFSMLFNSFELSENGIVVRSNSIFSCSFYIIHGKEGLQSCGAGPHGWDDRSLMLAEYVACKTTNARRRAIINS